MENKTKPNKSARPNEADAWEWWIKFVNYPDLWVTKERTHTLMMIEGQWGHLYRTSRHQNECYEQLYANGVANKGNGHISPKRITEVCSRRKVL